jgi:hypothetical protein
MKYFNEIQNKKLKQCSCNIPYFIYIDLPSLQSVMVRRSLHKKKEWFSKILERFSCVEDVPQDLAADTVDAVHFAVCRRCHDNLHCDSKKFFLIYSSNLYTHKIID